MTRPSGGAKAMRWPTALESRRRGARSHLWGHERRGPLAMLALPYKADGERHVRLRIPDRLVYLLYVGDATAADSPDSISEADRRPAKRALRIHLFNTDAAPARNIAKAPEDACHAGRDHQGDDQQGRAAHEHSPREIKEQDDAHGLKLCQADARLF